MHYALLNSHTDYDSITNSSDQLDRKFYLLVLAQACNYINFSSSSKEV